MTSIKLFAVYLGGHAKGCNIEVHDVVFAVGADLHSTFPILEKKWFGIRKALHVDAWVELNYVDGYQIDVLPADALSNESDLAESALKLYFINFGAYEPNFFGEVHQSGFYVASSKKEAQAKARKQLCLKLKQRHHDDTIVIEDSIADVDDCIEINNVDKWKLTFTPTDIKEEFPPKCEYIKLS
ncbi:hypothetical protein DSM106972_085430 [Dulcicalothrix desertica PCC 7102]|uniref:DUF1543 domain-containing protein n=1 Tax=Dulcicalothrix desertica PCC 7102 TaxID=232991 RepID=A0A433UT18_9CYAN|nr:DUF1543 domain-containing protein [Dulcicalothrix desertica]RUS96993.1 hypothetical protein DSM106972_085430 [Dulcicalothrix desertica PCC 7102]TWH53964.1 uncharacterized protein DUF1543 [Dulcicalothrix desertica PCC 7102]